MEFPAMPFSASSLSPTEGRKMSCRHTARPRQLSMRVPIDACWQSGCSRPSQRRFASAGGGMAISSSRRHKLLMQSLQHQTVASLSPTPAQRRSSSLQPGFGAGGFPAPLSGATKPKASAA